MPILLPAYFIEETLPRIACVWECSHCNEYFGLEHPDDFGTLDLQVDDVNRRFATHCCSKHAEAGGGWGLQPAETGQRKAFLIGLHYMQDPASFFVNFGYDATDSNERFGTLERAEDRCLELNCFTARVDEHVCCFSAEELPYGDFGIVCATHPAAVEVF